MSLREKMLHIKEENANSRQKMSSMQEMQHHCVSLSAKKNKKTTKYRGD